MLLQIDYHSGVPIYRQIIRQIRRQIMTDTLQPGDRLCRLFHRGAFRHRQGGIQVGALDGLVGDTFKPR